MNSIPVYGKPLPQPGPDDEAFWAGCKRHELLLQRCRACGDMRYWGRPMCARCNAFETEVVKAGGRGTVWSFTTTHHAFHPAWKDAVPYTVVVVELAEGPRMTSILREPSGEIRVGCNVEVVFDDVTPEVTLPKFRLVP